MSSAPRIYPSLSEYTPLYNKFTCVTIPESTPPSQNIPPFFNTYMRTSHNLPLPPRIYLPFQYLYANVQESSLLSQNIPLFAKTIILCDPPRIYPFFPEYTPLFNKFTCATLLESTTPSQNITPLFNTYMQPSQNLPLPPRIYLPFQYLYANLLESTVPLQYIPPFAKLIILCDPPRIYPSLSEYTPLFNNSNMLRDSQCRCKVWKYTALPDYTRVDCGRPRIYPRVDPEQYPRRKLRCPLYCEYVKCLRRPESTPLSQNIHPFLTNLHV